MKSDPTLSDFASLLKKVRGTLPGAPPCDYAIDFINDRQGESVTTASEHAAAVALCCMTIMEIGAWWERKDPSHLDFTVDAARAGWVAVVNEIPSAMKCRSLVRGPAVFRTYPAACLAALRAILEDANDA